jgi:hypothetical protein
METERSEGRYGSREREDCKSSATSSQCYFQSLQGDETGGKERDRERETDRDREADRERETERERQTDRDREADRERQSFTGKYLIQRKLDSLQVVLLVM